MIVKNEEAMLARCLESVKEADEIIVVDTGSFDKTKEIAQSFGAHVFDFEWEDDFAKARNYAKSLCTGDYIISIDADEVLEVGGIEKIRDLLNFMNPDSVGVHMKCNNTDFFAPRLFKNSPDIFFEGVIHECINSVPNNHLEVVIEYGTSPAHEFDPDRNMRILEKAVIANPNNTRYLYYLGREFGYKEMWDKAIITFERYLISATWLPEKADVYFMLALCYWNTNQGERARVNALMAININAHFKAAILLMAEMSFERNALQWKEMAKTATNEGTLFARNNYLII